MNELQLIMIAITTLALLSTVICGFWIKYGPQDQIDESSITFHMGSAIVTTLLFLGTLVTLTL